MEEHHVWRKKHGIWRERRALRGQGDHQQDAKAKNYSKPGLACGWTRKVEELIGLTYPNYSKLGLACGWTGYKKGEQKSRKGRRS